mgnify:CR=1 FL=1
MFTRILVPIDFSDPSDAALEYAASVAARFNAALHVLHVVDDPYRAAYAAEVFVPEVEGLREELIADAVGKSGHGIIQYNVGRDPRWEEYEALVTKSGRPLVWTALLAGSLGPNSHRAQLARAADQVARGRLVRLQQRVRARHAVRQVQVDVGAGRGRDGGDDHDPAPRAKEGAQHGAQLRWGNGPNHAAKGGGTPAAAEGKAR